MITRRRGRMTSNCEEPVEVEVVSTCVNDLPSPSESFPGEDLDTASIELDELFGIDDFKWTLERDSDSALFDMELAELGVYTSKEQDSGIEASSASSPERRSSGFRIRSQQSLSGHINKNAIAARLNRLKKKEYVSSLEKKVTGLSSENNVLKQENSQLTKRVEELEDETRAPTRTTTTMPSRGNG